MSSGPDRLGERIATRLQIAGVDGPRLLVEELTAFIRLLSKWNRRVNLTGFALDDPSDDALDRLVVEPVVVASHIRRSDQVYVDVGSGSGSPAIPLKLAVPRLRTTLVEVRAKKSAFLREVIRELRLESTDVINASFAEYADREPLKADVVTIRAVAESPGLWASLERILAPAGQVLWFSSSLHPPSGWALESSSFGGRWQVSVLTTVHE